MGFITPALLGGALLVGIPIVLHLIMRRQAKQFTFPALRFVERRRSLNQHRLRLRHLVLLALRCAVIAILALALARPVLRESSARGEEDGPIATALVFDNSLRMQYQHENQSRLERAKELGVWLVGQLPAGSPITVIDRAGRQRGQDLDRDAAELRVERLEPSSVVRPPEEPLRDAFQWLAERPDHRGEIYVFTDMSEEAWPAELLADLSRRLDERPGTKLYLIDVGVERPRNLSLDALRLSSQQLSPGAVLQIDGQLARTGAAASDGEAANDVQTTDSDEVVVELFLSAAAGEAQKRGQQVVSPGPGAAAPLEFSIAGLDLGTHQGFVRIAGGDALPADDMRYFTVEVRSPRKVLLLSQGPGDGTLFLREALAPTTAAANVPARFECEVGLFAWLREPAAATASGQNELRQMQFSDLSNYDAVCLVDPPPLPDSAWQLLADFVRDGGGLGVFLGRSARRDEFNAAAPQLVLPAELRWQSHEATYLRPVAVEHPALAELRELVDIAPWPEFPVFKYWDLAAGAADAHVVATFANGKPAIVERRLGAGRVLLMTTSVSDPAHDDPWNLLPTGPDPWPFLVLAGGLADYLAGGGDVRLNYVAGQPIALPLAPDEQVTSYVLQLPGGTAVRQSLAAGQSELAISSADALGNYRVLAGGERGRLDRGFSVNGGDEISRLARTTAERITSGLGRERVRVARTREEIEVRVGQGRVGRELFPVLILSVALVLAAEQWLANRFYEINA
jgi:hypothetical protein